MEISAPVSRQVDTSDRCGDVDPWGMVQEILG
jgi:hypothetical protein